MKKAKAKPAVKKTAKTAAIKRMMESEMPMPMRKKMK